MRHIALAAALLSGVSVFLTPQACAQSQAHTMVVPSDLKWAPVPSLPPGAQIAVIEGPMNTAVPFTVRLKFPADYKIPAHSHPAIEHVTVISGTFNMGTGDKLDPTKTMALPPGSVAIMQPKTNHFAWTKEETIVQLHGVGPWGVTYVNPADDPMKK
jgi:quercetin dioxygenase-like cupin family protein